MFIKSSTYEVYTSHKKSQINDQAVKVERDTFPLLLNGTPIYTINLMRSTCRVLVNGPKYMTFVDQDYPILCKYVLVKHNPQTEIALKESIRSTWQLLEMNTPPKAKQPVPSRQAASTDTPTMLSLNCPNATEMNTPPKTKQSVPPIQVASTETPSLVISEQAANENIEASTPKSSPALNSSVNTANKDTSIIFKTPPTGPQPPSTPHRRSSLIKRLKSRHIANTFPNSTTAGGKTIKAIRDLNVQAVERYDTLISKINNVQEDLSEKLTNTIGNLRDELASLKNSMNTQNKRVKEELEEKLGSLDIKFSAEVENLKLTTKANKSKIDKMESKLQVANTKIEEQLNTITNLKKELENHQTKQIVTDITPKHTNNDNKKEEIPLKIEKAKENTNNGTQQDDKKMEKVKLNVVQSQIYEHEGSSFLGFGCNVKTSEELEQFKMLVTSSVDNKPTHVMSAHIFQEGNASRVDSEDDGETGGWNIMLDTLLINNSKDTAVIVCRWYGGTKIFGKRFEIITKVTEEIIAKLIPNLTPTQPRPHNQQTKNSHMKAHDTVTTIYLYDSTGKQVQ